MYPRLWNKFVKFMMLKLVIFGKFPKLGLGKQIYRLGTDLNNLS